MSASSKHGWIIFVGAALATAGLGCGGGGGGGGAGDTSCACYLPPTSSGPAAGMTDFEGIDLSAPPTAPITGCAGGFDPTSGAMKLSLDGANHALVVDAFQGVLRANGAVCTAPDGSAVMAASVRSLSMRAISAIR